MASVAQAPATKRSTPPLQTIPVKSRFIASMEYDQGNLTLTTHLINGSIYQHKMVTPVEWETLKISDNLGKTWSSAIKGKKLSVKIKSAKAPRSELKRRTK